MTRRRRAAAVLAIAATLTVTGCTAAETPPAPSPVDETPAAAGTVSSLAVIGDSISLGMAACGANDECVDASWAVGTDPAVDSIALRLAESTGVAPQTLAAAQVGASVTFGERAVDAVTGSGADLVLVLLGANDACKPTLDEVTPADEFAEDYAALLDGVHTALPGAQIVAYSVPDLLRLWELGRGDAETTSLWERSPSCRSLLWGAASDAPADVERREGIARLVDDYNASIADACAAIEDCTYDDGDVHGVHFEAADVSTVDSFHPSASGQAMLAAAAWPAVQRALGG